MRIHAIIRLLICGILIVVLGLFILNPLFLKALFRLNHYNCGDKSSNVISDLVYGKNGYTMLISGTGRMSEYIPNEWSYNLCNTASGWIVSIRTAEIKEGVTSLSNCLFAGCTRLNEVYIPKSMKEIGTKAFAYCEDLKTIHYSGTMKEWHEIEVKSLLWNDESSIEKVICSDGSITVS